MTIDIGSNKDPRGAALSNFCEYPFIVDHMRCASMEGFLQALKFPDVNEQKRVCALVGIEAKRAGRAMNDSWQKTQTLWWRGVSYLRSSVRHRLLIARGYNALLHNDEFREALIATGKEELTHSIGKNDPKKTVLTEVEFCHILTQMRTSLQVWSLLNTTLPPGKDWRSLGFS